MMGEDQRLVYPSRTSCFARCACGGCAAARGMWGSTPHPGSGDGGKCVPCGDGGKRVPCGHNGEAVSDP